MARYTTNACPIRNTDGQSKRRFLTLDEAEHALDRIWRFAIGGTTRSTKLPCRSYYCEACYGYHHTSEPLRQVEEENV